MDRHKKDYFHGFGSSWKKYAEVFRKKSSYRKLAKVAYEYWTGSLEPRYTLLSPQRWVVRKISIWQLLSSLASWLIPKSARKSYAWKFYFRSAMRLRKTYWRDSAWFQTVVILSINKPSQFHLLPHEWIILFKLWSINFFTPDPNLNLSAGKNPASVSSQDLIFSDNTSNFTGGKSASMSTCCGVCLWIFKKIDRLTAS